MAHNKNEKFPTVANFFSTLPCKTTQVWMWTTTLFYSVMQNSNKTWQRWLCPNNAALPRSEIFYRPLRPKSFFEERKRVKSFLWRTTSITVGFDSGNSRTAVS